MHAVVTNTEEAANGIVEEVASTPVVAFALASLAEVRRPYWEEVLPWFPLKPVDTAKSKCSLAGLAPCQVAPNRL